MEKTMAGLSMDFNSDPRMCSIYSSASFRIYQYIWTHKICSAVHNIRPNLVCVCISIRPMARYPCMAFSFLPFLFAGRWWWVIRKLTFAKDRSHRWCSSCRHGIPGRGKIKRGKSHREGVGGIEIWVAAWSKTDVTTFLSFGPIFIDLFRSQDSTSIDFFLQPAAKWRAIGYSGIQQGPGGFGRTNDVV